jgi:P27 family predicted phage terminase small subunit
MMEGPGADSEEKREPVSDIDIAVADSLKVLDLKRPIREADILACLCCYCHAYSLWRDASEQLEAEGLLSETKGGRTCRNPLIKIVNDAAGDMLRFAAEFGLTPVARTRLAQGLQASKFDGLLGGPKEPSA